MLFRYARKTCRNGPTIEVKFFVLSRVNLTTESSKNFTHKNLKKCRKIRLTSFLSLPIYSATKTKNAFLEVLKMSFLTQLCYDAMNNRTKYDYANSYKFAAPCSKYASQARNASYFIDGKYWYKRIASLFVDGNSARHYRVRATRFTMNKRHGCGVAYLLFADRSILRFYDDNGILVIKLLDKNGVEYIKTLVTKYADKPADNAGNADKPVDNAGNAGNADKFVCLVYPRPHCENCLWSCKSEDGEPCSGWQPDRGAHPSTPNPCELGGNLGDLCFGICNICSKARQN